MHSHRLRSLSVTILILLFVFGRLILSQTYKAPTVDEPHHIVRGLIYLRLGKLIWNGNPPLASALLAAPLLLDSRMIPDNASLTATDDFRLLGQTFLQTVQGRWRAAFFVARWPNMLMLLLLLALLFTWARQWFGLRAGLMVLTLGAFDPNLLANAQLATTDIAVTLFCASAGYWAWRFQQTGRWREAVGLGLSAGLALGAKFTALVVIGLIGLVLLIGAWPVWWRQPRRLLRALAAAGLTGWVLWLIYGFSIGPLKGTALLIPAPDFLGELLWQSTANIEQHRAFLANQLYTSGSAWYFPIAFLLKTPTAVVGALAVALIYLFTAGRVRPSGIWLPVSLFIGYFITLILLPLNIGYRHLLPILPFGYLLIGTLFQPARSLGWGRGKRALALGLMGWSVTSSLAVWPYDLAYFAEWGGGPTRGYRWLVDSSLDWGQDLYALPAALQDKTGSIYLSYFGPVDPRVLGLPITPLPDWDDATLSNFHPANPAPGLYVLSATNLQGVILNNPDTFDFFRRRAPDGHIGYSMLTYQVTGPSAQWVAVCDTPTFKLDADTVEQLVGDGHRRVYFNCEQSWIIPAGGSGWYVLPGEVSNAVQAWGGQTQLVYRQTGAFSVYTYDPAGFQPPRAYSLNFSNTLTLQGEAQTTAHELVTIWQAQGPASPTLSIFAHHVAPDGFVREAADGLGVSPAVWQAGDVIVQWHRFTGPLAPEAVFDIGVYNWHTGERLLTPEGANHYAVPVSEFTD